MNKIRFNLNDNVKVKLNEYGHQIHKQWHADFLDLLRPEYRMNHPYRPPTEDEEGYSSWQLWSLMQIFGPHIELGRFPPFSTEMILVGCEIEETKP